MSTLSHLHLVRWMGDFTAALLTKLPAMDPPLLASSMRAFSSLHYEPDRVLVKAYYMQVGVFAAAQYRK